MQNSTEQILAWARTANQQQSPAFLALQARILADAQPNDAQIAFLQRCQRTATKRARWIAERENGYPSRKCAA